MLAALLLSCAKPAAPVTAAATECSADAIYETYLEALRGTRDPATVKHWYARASMAVESGESPIQTEVWWLGPDLHITRVAMPGVGVIEMAWDGSIGWAVELGSVRLMGDAELQSYRSEAGMTLDNRGMYTELSCIGRSEFGGQDAWELVGEELATGSTIRTWYDPDTGLQLGHRTRTPDGIETTVFLREYTDYGGVLWPTQMEAPLGSGISAHYTVEEIILDPAPPELVRPEGL